MLGENPRGSSSLRPRARLGSAEPEDRNTKHIPQPVSSDRWSTVWPQLARLGSRFSAPWKSNAYPGALSRWRQRPSRGWCTDGSPLRATGSCEPAGRPRFDQEISPGGYIWWYLDALSNDRTQGLTIIVLLGSVFSPYYAWSGRRNPLNHCAVNVALYGRGPNLWTMTERRHDVVSRGSKHCVIGPSNVEWTGSELRLELCELANPSPSPSRRPDPSQFRRLLPIDTSCSIPKNATRGGP